MKSQIFVVLCLTIILINCAETAARLQQINIVDQFCFDTGLEIYLSKTEVIVFHNGGPRAYKSWYFRGFG